MIGFHNKANKNTIEEALFGYFKKEGDTLKFYDVYYKNIIEVLNGYDNTRDNLASTGQLAKSIIEEIGNEHYMVMGHKEKMQFNTTIFLGYEYHDFVMLDKKIILKMLMGKFLKQV